MRRMWFAGSAALLFSATSVWAGIGSGVTINEIRTEQSGQDLDEYFELAGTPSTLLDDLTYIVIGDGDFGPGTIEAIVPLVGNQINASGFFVVAELTWTGGAGTADLLLPISTGGLATPGLNFEGGDNVTHMLVSGYSGGATGDDIDLDDDGTADNFPWTSVETAVSLVIDPTGGDPFYADQFGGANVGPDGAFVPAQVSACATNVWVIGLFDDITMDTAGAANPPCPPDTDMDGIFDDADNCPDDFNPDQNDCDLNGVGDVCEIADGTQTDANMNGIPDECESTDIIINEILYDPAPDAAGDANGDGIRDGAQDEFVEIANNTGGVLDLTDWTIEDATGLRHTFPAGTSVPDQCVAVVFGGGQPTGLFNGAVVQIASEGGLGLNNDGDVVIARDAVGAARAIYNFGAEGVADESLTRDPDITGTEPLGAHSLASGSGGALFSPGSKVDGTAFSCGAPVDSDLDGVLDAFDNCPLLFNPTQLDCDGDGVGDVCEIDEGTQIDDNMNGIPDDCESTDIVINEILYDPSNAGGDANGDGIIDFGDDEFVEIVNASGGPLDISNWLLSDAVGIRHVFSAGTIVEDNCSIVVFGGGIPTGGFGGSLVQVSSEGGLGLSNGGDTVLLADENGTPVAAVNYAGGTGTNQSITRNVDITGTFFIPHTTVPPGFEYSPGTNADGTVFGGCTPPSDMDKDGIIDSLDNCPNDANPGQDDCDGDGIGDVCAIAMGMSTDCNLNLIPDDCELDLGLAQDCNGNNLPDDCDLASGLLVDNNGNNVPDSCEIVVPAGLRINEIRLGQLDADNDEYLEIKGDPGSPLTGLRYLVIGDGAAIDGSGVIEAVISLDGGIIPFDGHFLAVEATYTLTGLLTTDLILPGNGLNFEDSDNVTHVLVANFYGFVGQDLDVDDDGVLDSTPWLSTVDAVGIIESEPPVGTEFQYGVDLGGETVGPDGTFQPGHVFRCETAGDWEVGAFDIADMAAADTPGAVNDDCTSSCTADLDGDQVVGFGDLLIILSNWECAGSGTCQQPIEELDIEDSPDGDVGFGDLLTVLSLWGPCP